ncbi:hypothetical protein [Morganella morganii IS15]|nr:hypothetical protein [Morganella morganii IS15]
MQIPCIAVMTIQATHQTALEKDDKTNARAINGPAGFK